MALAKNDLLVGETIRKLREARRLSLRTLAAKAAFSPSFISQVENGQASPSISSLERIANALGVTLVEFFEGSESLSAPVVRAEQRRRLESRWSKAEIESLTIVRTGLLESVLITLKPGGSSGKRPHSQPREQFAFVVSGEVQIVLAGESQTLGAGDAVSIPPQKPFRWTNESAVPVQVLIVTNRFP